MQRFAFVAALLFAAMNLQGQGSPRLASVTPESGKAEVEFTAAGENLGKEKVAELYLTDGKDDIKVQIVNQANEAIKFKAPGSVKPGRYSLMFLSGDKKSFIEQPVKVTIE